MKIENNVLSFLEKASIDVGKIEAEKFSILTFGELYKSQFIKSPIEQIFYIGFLVMAKHFSCNLRTLDDFVEDEDTSLQLFYEPQLQVGKYRVDFAFCYFNHRNERLNVIVELDGHDFHDKDKRQRAYEKSRDRFLTRRGFKLFHFTGSEVAKDPYKVALEVLCGLGIAGDVYLDNYSPENPFGIE